MQEQIDEAWTPSSSPAQYCTHRHTHTLSTWSFGQFFGGVKRGILNTLTSQCLKNCINVTWLMKGSPASRGVFIIGAEWNSFCPPKKSICSQGSFLLKQLWLIQEKWGTPFRKVLLRRRARAKFRLAPALCRRPWLGEVISGWLASQRKLFWTLGLCRRIYKVTLKHIEDLASIRTYI